MSEPSFRQRVDASVLRILELKLRLYGGEQTVSAIVPNSAELPAIIKEHQSMLLNLPAEAITLLAPSPDEFPTVFRRRPLKMKTSSFSPMCAPGSNVRNAIHSRGLEKLPLPTAYLLSTGQQPAIRSIPTRYKAFHLPI